MIDIFIVDDHAIVRKGIRQLVCESNGLNITGEAGDFNQILELLPKIHVDIMLLDINLPGQTGLEVLTHIKKEYPDISVLILTMYPEEQYAVRAIKSGASGYLTKDSLPDELIEAIHVINGGNKYISKSLADKLASLIYKSNSALPHENLSNREFQIMLMIAFGKTPKDIASELFLSIKTISTFKSRLFEKMNFKSNSELVQYVNTNNLLP